VKAGSDRNHRKISTTAGARTEALNKGSAWRGDSRLVLISHPRRNWDANNQGSIGRTRVRSSLEISLEDSVLHLGIIGTRPRVIW
jgi:hypothetical protein